MRSVLVHPLSSNRHRALAVASALALAGACGNSSDGDDGAPAGSGLGTPGGTTAGATDTVPAQGEPTQTTPAAPTSAAVQPSDTSSAEPTMPEPTHAPTSEPTTEPTSPVPSVTLTGPSAPTMEPPIDGAGGMGGAGEAGQEPMGGAGGMAEAPVAPDDGFDRLAACSGGPYGDPFATASAPMPVAGSEGGGDNFYIAEGPVWLGGAVYFSLFSGAQGFPSTIKRFTPGGSVEDFIPNAGSNGLAIDVDGQLLAATHDQQSLSKYDVDSKERSGVVGEYMGQAFNSPNDIAVHSNGTIYFTDPDHQNGGRPSVGDKHLYVVQDGSATAVSTAHSNGGAGPNGVALSLDEAMLYVSGSGAGIRQFVVNGAGTLGDESSFVEDAFNGDGMTLDCAGNLYIAVNSEVKAFSPDGMPIGTLTTPAQATNVAFGGADGRTLFITTFAQGMAGLHSVQLGVPGLPY